jgi:hypothetical protein
MRRPAFQFYPADWLTDLGLRKCSIAARGLWVDMLCLAHKSERYGHLVVAGAPMSDPEVVAAVAGASLELLAELEGARVFSRDPGGAIYSRRMVRDERVREARAAGGELGAVHGAKGAAHGRKGGRPQKPPLPKSGRGVKKPPPSSSSSSSSSSATSSKASAAGEKISPSADGWNGVTAALRESWQRAYPALDLEAELAGARAWVEANPANRKSNWSRFLVGWLGRKQDRAPARRQAPTWQAPSPAERRAEDWAQVIEGDPHGTTIDGEAVRDPDHDVRSHEDGEHVRRLRKG